MAKCIVVTTCQDCPYLKYSGGFGHPKYKPICGYMGAITLPYTTVRGLENAQATYVIPDWCPLTDLPEAKES